MTTIDDITGKKPAPVNNTQGSELPPAGTAPKAPVQSTTPVPPVHPQPANLTSLARKEEPVKPRISYAQIFQQTSPYKPPTPGELEQERKKQKREAIFAAIGDGISAISNLYFTTQGAPNSYNPSLSLSSSYKRRYDQLKAEREANNRQYTSGYMRALQLDDEGERADRSWRRQLERDGISDERYNKEQERNESRYREGVEYRNKKDKTEEERWKQQFDAGERQRENSNTLAWANHNLSALARKDNKELRKLQLQLSGAKGARGKRIGFSDGTGNEVGIYENVWKGSMQQVFDAIANELRPAGKEGSSWDRKLKKLDTPQKKEDFVKQNWNKSKSASSIMLALSQIDPASMISDLNDGENNDDTPPSRRSESNNDDVPPSRRK